jgi:hypothetical protein
MKRAAIVLLYAVGGYLCCAVVGYFLVGLLSSNTHARSVEAGMTSVFVFGPLGSLAAIVVGVVRTGRRVIRPGAANR